ncbi:MAG: hypothetical protein QOE92_393 [Chloroflexota bacterium]|nr:hypothetical protein [Chloroflexota bacterium]
MTPISQPQPSSDGEGLRDYRAWHEQYDDPDGSLAVRLGIVQRRLAELLDAAPAGPLRLISMCAGQGRDVIGVLPGHPRRGDVSCHLVELDAANAAVAREQATAAGLEKFDVVEADAALAETYAPFAPADIVLACGVFGNISDTDVENTVRTVSMLCRPGAGIVWTRHRQEPDLTPAIRRWFAESGWEELAFDAPDNATLSGIGAARLRGAAAAWRAGHRFFTFLR